MTKYYYITAIDVTNSMIYNKTIKVDNRLDFLKQMVCEKLYILNLIELTFSEYEELKNFRG